MEKKQWDEILEKNNVPCYFSSTFEKLLIMILWGQNQTKNLS